MSFIEMKNIRKDFGKLTILHGVDMTLEKGEVISIIGPSGAGKSTLLRTVMGLLKPLHGQILIGGDSVHTLSQREIAARISFVSTENVRASNLKVNNIVGLGRAPYTNWIGSLTDEDREIVQESLRLVGMEAFGEKNVSTLSDGECQRVMIARSLAQDTPVILLDEPTAFLDLPNKYEIVLLLRSLAREQGKTILFSTHDLNVALELCDPIVMIDQGKFLYGSPQEMIDAGNIDRLFRDGHLLFDHATRTVQIR